MRLRKPPNRKLDFEIGVKMSSKSDIHKKEKTKYCNYLEQIKQRLSAIQQFTLGNATLSELGREDYDIEFVAIQLRKILELIAFSSLIANKKVYSKKYKKFATNWNAKLMLRDLENVNSDFYPKPLYQEGVNEHGITHFEFLKDGYLTKDEFVFLYNKCGKALHAMNPYNDETVINLKKSINEWLQRIITLLTLYQVTLVDSDEAWIVQLQSSVNNKAHVLTSIPVEG